MTPRLPITKPPSNPPLDMKKVDRCLDMMERLVGR
jgi:hypothetical protein